MYTKNLFSAILCHDKTIALCALDQTLYIAHDTFPKNKKNLQNTSTCMHLCCILSTKISLIQGFKKWPEKTSMSLSGHHLKIYKSLLKDFLPQPNTNDPKPPEHMYGSELMQSIFQMLYLAIHHTHINNHWKVIWNMFLEKDIGNPQINRLHTPHH